MTMPDSHASRGVISIELDTEELALGKLISTTETFFDLLREVATAVTPTGDVHWIVQAISMSSPVELAVRPVADDKVAPDVLDRVSDAIVSGIEVVQKAAQRPPHFSDRALEHARLLAKETTSRSTRVRVRRQAEKSTVNVTVQLIANVDSILGSSITEIGTVEGRLEAFNVHGNRRYFIVYDALTDERIRCDFAHRIDVREIGAAAERRVAIRGEIEYRQTGEIVRVRAAELEVFPEEDDLPSADSVRGILGA
jgi:hypothetical protein